MGGCDWPYVLVKLDLSLSLWVELLPVEQTANNPCGIPQQKHSNSVLPDT